MSTDAAMSVDRYGSSSSSTSKSASHQDRPYGGREYRNEQRGRAEPPSRSPSRPVDEQRPDSRNGSPTPDWDPSSIVGSTANMSLEEQEYRHWLQATTSPSTPRPLPQVSPYSTARPPIYRLTYSPQRITPPPFSPVLPANMEVNAKAPTPNTDSQTAAPDADPRGLSKSLTPDVEPQTAAPDVEPQAAAPDAEPQAVAPDAQPRGLIDFSLDHDRTLQGRKERPGGSQRDGRASPHAQGDNIPSTCKTTSAKASAAKAPSFKDVRAGSTAPTAKTKASRDKQPIPSAKPDARSAPRVVTETYVLEGNAARRVLPGAPGAIAASLTTNYRIDPRLLRVIDIMEKAATPWPTMCDECAEMEASRKFSLAFCGVLLLTGCRPVLS
jgi:hypothetical protein